MTKKKILPEAAVPEAFLARMERLLGTEYPAFRASYDQPPRSGLRVNTLKITPEDFAHLAPFPLEPLDWPPGVFLVPDEAAPGCRPGSRPGSHPYHAAGLYYLGDPSAMVPAALLAPRPGDYVLDLSAAPGGKATHLASLLGGTGLLVANEIHPQRAWDLAQNLERWGARNAVILNETPERIAAAFPEFFDRVLVDAPCSGEGMFRKSEAARREWEPELVQGCAVRQAHILEAAAAAVRPGGVLAYVTCTFAPEEDEAVVAGFLAGHPEFSLLEPPRRPGFAPGRPDWLPPSAGAFQSRGGPPWPPMARATTEGRPYVYRPHTETDPPAAGLDSEQPLEHPDLTGSESAAASHLSRAVRLWPHLFPGEGHFIALLHKASGEGAPDNQVPLAEASALDYPSRFAAATAAYESRITDHGSRRKQRPARATHHASRITFGLPRPLHDLYLAFCAEHLAAVPAGEALALAGTYLYQAPPGLVDSDLAGLKSIHPGWWLGVFKKERFEPSHALALALRPSEARQTLDLAPGVPDLAAYLRGETLRIPGVDGWVLVTVSGHPLGWARRAANLLKSHYPRGLRRY